MPPPRSSLKNYLLNHAANLQESISADKLVYRSFFISIAQSPRPLPRKFLSTEKPPSWH